MEAEEPKIQRGIQLNSEFKATLDFMNSVSKQKEKIKKTAGTSGSWL